MNRCETITTEERDSEEMKREHSSRGERQKGRDEKLFEQVRDYNNRGERQKGRDEKLL